MNSITRRYAFLHCFRPVSSVRVSWCGSTGDFRRAGTDRILVEEFNDNWDKIDAAIAGRQDAGGTFAAELPSGGVQRVESPLGNAATVKVTGSQLKSTYVCKGTRLRLWGIR